jgi:hypothetical protein
MRKFILFSLDTICVPSTQDVDWCIRFERRKRKSGHSILSLYWIQADKIDLFKIKEKKNKYNNNRLVGLIIDG